MKWWGLMLWLLRRIGREGRVAQRWCGCGCDLPESNHLDLLIDLEGFDEAHDIDTSVAAICENGGGHVEK